MVKRPPKYKVGDRFWLTGTAPIFPYEVEILGIREPRNKKDLYLYLVQAKHAGLLVPQRLLRTKEEAVMCRISK